MYFTTQTKEQRERNERIQRQIRDSARNAAGKVWSWVKRGWVSLAEKIKEDNQAMLEAASGNWTRRASGWQARQDATYDLASRLMVEPTAQQMGIPTLLRGGAYEARERAELRLRGQQRFGTMRAVSRIYEKGSGRYIGRHYPKKTYYYRKNYYFNKPRVYLKPKRYYRKKRYYQTKRFRRRRFNKF